MAAPDPHDARAVLHSLMRRVTRALNAPHLACVRMLPRVDGTAAITLRVGEVNHTLHWVAPPSVQASQGVPSGAVVSADVDARLCALVEGALARALQSPTYALLAFVNRDRSHLTFNDGVVDVFFAGRLAPGLTRWFHWTFAEAFQGAAHRFFLHFDGPSGRLTFQVTSPGVTLQDAEALAETPHYRLWLTEDPRASAARAQVSEQVERFLGFLLARAVHPGMVLRGDLAPRFVDGLDPDPGGADPYGPGAPVSTSRWGNPRQWHQFFSDFEVARAGLCGLSFTEPLAFVTHGEPECHRVEPTVRPRHHVFARLPFAHRWVAPEPGSREFMSVMGEREVVFGAAPLLERVMDAAQAHPSSRFVVLNNTCLPKMVGDDLARLVAGPRPGTSKPVVVMNTDLDSPEATYQDLLRQVARTGEPCSQRDVQGVGVMGFPPGRGREELMALCEAMGLPVVGCLGPELSARRAEAFRDAALHVVWPAPPWPRLREELFGAAPAAVISPWAPMGLAGSLHWFSRVVEAFDGCDGAILERWRDAVAPLEERFAALVSEVRGRGVGFVVDLEEVGRLVDPARAYGVRLLPLMVECGFVPHVLLRLPDPGDAQEGVAAAEARLGEAVAPLPGLSIHTFHSRETLDALLSAAPFSLLYSELSCDDRLARHGLTGFGLDLWEMGPAGALRSLERMVRLHRWPFFSRYGRRACGAHTTEDHER